MRIRSVSSLVAAVSLAVPAPLVAWVLLIHDRNDASDRIAFFSLVCAPVGLALLSSVMKNSETRPAPLIFACLIEYTIAFPLLWLTSLFALPGMVVLLLATIHSLVIAIRRPNPAPSSIQPVEPHGGVE